MPLEKKVNKPANEQANHMPFLTQSRSGQAGGGMPFLLAIWAANDFSDDLLWLT